MRGGGGLMGGRKALLSLSRIANLTPIIATTHLPRSSSRRSVARCSFGQIMVVDMAGLERTKKSAVYGSSMRESNR